MNHLGGRLENDKDATVGEIHHEMVESFLVAVRENDSVVELSLDVMQKLDEDILVLEDGCNVNVLGKRLLVLLLLDQEV